jgi:ferredoxin
MRKLVINEELCIGCGHCMEICPKVFELIDDKSNVTGPDQCGTCNCEEQSIHAL